MADQPPQMRSDQASPVAKRILPRASWCASLAIALAGLASNGLTVEAAPRPSALIADIDLSRPFGARSAWRLIVTQGTPVEDPNYPGEKAPGVVDLCLQKAAAAPCDGRLIAMPRPPASLPADVWEPHFLSTAQVVYPRGASAPPLLLVRTASRRSGDGDQAIFTQLLAYRPANDQFVQVYAHVTGHNNNQEVRFVASGPLRGSVVSAEPTEDRPFGFWISVNRPAADYTYTQILRYRSATPYGDGNPLAVVDSEMANIEKRLGLWSPGSPSPLPARSCPRPRLVKMELWCE